MPRPSSGSIPSVGNSAALTFAPGINSGWSPSLMARRAVLQGSTWILEDGAAWQLDEYGEPRFVEARDAGGVKFDQRPIVMQAALQQYYADRRAPRELTAQELGKLAGTLEETGQDAQRLKVHLQFKYSIGECGERGMTYAVPLKVTFRLFVYDKDPETGTRMMRDAKEEEVYFGEIPLMTD